MTEPANAHWTLYIILRATAILLYFAVAMILIFGLFLSKRQNCFDSNF